MKQPTSLIQSPLVAPHHHGMTFSKTWDLNSPKLYLPLMLSWEIFVASPSFNSTYYPPGNGYISPPNGKFGKIIELSSQKFRLGWDMLVFLEGNHLQFLSSHGTPLHIRTTWLRHYRSVAGRTGAQQRLGN